MTVKRQGADFGETALQANVLVETIPCAAGLWTVDLAQCLLNGPAIALFGFVESELGNIPRIWSGRVHEEDRDKYAEFRERAAKRQFPLPCDYRFFPNDGGAPYWIREFSAPFTLNMPHCNWQILSLYMDISDLRKTPEFVASGCNIEDIIDGLFHDTQNDLHRVAMELELARMGLADLSDLAHTHETIGRLENEIKDLRGYVSPMQKPPSSCDPGVVLEGVSANWQMGNRHRSIKVAWALSRSLPIVPLHQKLLGRALESLIDCCANLIQEEGELLIAAERQERQGQTYAEIKLMAISASPLRQEVVESILQQLSEPSQIVSGIKRALEVLRRHYGEISFTRHGNRQLELKIRLKSAPW